MPGYLKMKTEITTWTAVTPTAWISEKKPNLFMKLLHFILRFFRDMCSPSWSAVDPWLNPRQFFWMDPWHPGWDRCGGIDNFFWIDWDHVEELAEKEIKEELLEKSSEYAKNRNKKLQHLHKCMMQYENKTGISMEKLRGFLLQRNGVQSRSELTDEQLEIEIKHFTSI